MRPCWLIAILACAAFAQDFDTYYVIFLRPDPARQTIAQEESQKIQAAHMANIGKMAADGVLKAAGPFADENRAILGVFVMKAASLAEAKRMAEQDPTVTNHRDIVDAHTWLGPKGIGEEYAKLHREARHAGEYGWASARHPHPWTSMAGIENGRESGFRGPHENRRETRRGGSGDGRGHDRRISGVQAHSARRRRGAGEDRSDDRRRRAARRVPQVVQRGSRPAMVSQSAAIAQRILRLIGLLILAGAGSWCARQIGLHDFTAHERDGLSMMVLLIGSI